MPIMKLKLWQAVFALCVASPLGTLFSRSARADDVLVSFEAPSVPAGVESSPNSTLSIIDARFIDGQRSLRWSWQGGPAWLTLHRPISYEPGPKKLFGQDAGETFAPWVYAKQPVDGALRFSFGRRGQAKPDCGFDFGLAFTGWRTAWLMYDRDMQGKPVPGMDEIRIETPRGVDSGELYLDSLVIDEIVDARHHYPDRQVPFVNPAAQDQHWLPQLSLLNLRADPAESTASAEECTAVSEITGRITQQYLRAACKASRAVVDALIEEFSSYDIHDGPDGLRGRHLSFIARQIVIYPEATREDLAKQFISLRAYQSHMLRIAQAYHSPDLAAEDRHRLADAFVLMVRHFIDQGWAEGSTLGTVHHLGYEFREVAPAALLMRDVLAKQGVLEPVARAVAWYFNTNAVFTPDGIASNMDYYNTLAMGHLASILLLPDGPAKVTTLRQYSETLSRIMAHETPGVENGFKSDGTAFHHFGHYPAYAVGALDNGSSVIRALAGTPFALSPAARTNFRRALMTMRLYSNPDWAIGFAGRHPMPTNDPLNFGLSKLKNAFVNLAFSGDPDTGGPVDETVLAAALRIWPELKDDPQVAALNISAEPIPQGHWTLNYAAAGIHRDGQKTVTLRGYNKDVWSSEIYTEANRFGRYQSNGSIAVLNEGGNRTSGFIQEGWDWNHIPGVTGVVLPLDQLEAPGNGSLMMKSQRAFSGDSNLAGKYGVFAIDLFDHRLPGSKGLTALKSAFCFGPRIICLGTGIASSNAEHPTHTTLFQTSMRTPNDPIWIDAAEPVTAWPVTRASSKDQSSVLVDPYGNGYYVPKDQNLVVTRLHQHSKNEKTEQPTEGDFASAWIDHGKAPQGERYHYAIVLGADIKQMLEFEKAADSQQPPYRILRQDQQVHAVWDRATGVTGIACFKPATDLALDACPVRVVSQPALVMTQPQPDGAVLISVCDPALHLDHGKSQPVNIEVRLAGSWFVQAGDSVQVQPAGDHTILHLRMVEGHPAQMTLKPDP